MSSKAEKERQKQIQDKCQTLLTQMLRDEDNKYCVDCDAKGPRWASWNLGVFLCIRCAGIHRNLGVHISKVKSVNLDSWTPEQVVSLQHMGNSRARAVYEANLPDNFRRPQGDSALEAFVRAKYEAKKYIAKEWVPPPLPKVNWDKELEEEAERGRKKKKDAKAGGGGGHPVCVRKPDSVIPQPLPKPNTSPKTQRQLQPAAAASANSTPQLKVGRAAPAPSTDLLGLDTPLADATNSMSSDEMFTNFLSASPATSAAAPKRTPEEESFFNQPSSAPAAGAAAGEKRQLTTDSILALYGKTPQQPVTNNVFAGQPAPGQGGFITSFPVAAAPAGSAFQHQMPNGMMAPGSMYPMMGGQQHTAAAASNPFYNMACMNTTPQPSPAPSFANAQGVASAATGRLPQQMAGLGLGAHLTHAAAGGVSGVAQQQPVVFPTTFGHHQAKLGSTAAGQTLASNLWQ